MELSEGQGRGVAARGLGGLLCDLEVAPHLLDVSAPCPDVSVRQAAGSSDGRLHVPPEPDGRSALLGGRRCDLDLVEGEDLAFEGEPPARPGSAQDLDRLRGSADALGQRHREHAELFLPPSQRQPQDQPSSRDEVDRGGVLRQAEGVVKGGEEHARPELDVLRCRGERSECREERRHVTVAGPVMLADPHRLEPQRLGEASEVDDLPVFLDERPRRAGRNLGGEQADPDVRGHGGGTLPQPVPGRP